MKNRRDFLRKTSLIGASFTATALFSSTAHAAPKPDLWPRWQAHQPGSPIHVDHSAWDRLLTRYRHLGEDGVALFNYRGLQQAGRDELRQYLDLLQQTDVANLDRPAQFAYWVNLYNALTVKVVIDHYPLPSITDIDISPGFFSNGPWGKKLAQVSGEALSLDDIEHRILRPIWRDPRIHYAVNCASIGCPDLAAKAWQPKTLNVDLNKAAAGFINHPRGANVENSRLTISSIYKWFEDDFAADGGVINHLRQYANENLSVSLQSIEKVFRDRYDWSLNDYTEQG